jgi:uncharacterized protein
MQDQPDKTRKPDSGGENADTGNDCDKSSLVPEEKVLRSSPCPICKKMSVQKYRPFCSRHCADVDLARWLGGRYAIAPKPDDDDIED